MAKAFLRFLVSLIILFHCIGVTQLLSACAKDSSAFVGMMSMTEEESKKEKESKEDNLPDETIGQLVPILQPVAFHNFVSCILLAQKQSALNHQFWAELPTPPPDSKV